MHRWRPPSDPGRDDADRGSAPLEFLLAGLVLLVPTVYLVVVLGLVQSQSLGAETAARHVARAIARAPDAASARSRAEAVVEALVGQYGIDRSSVGLRLECTPAGSPCPAAGAMMKVTVSTRVALPLAPPVLGLDRATSISVEGSAYQRLSRWGAPG